MTSAEEIGRMQFNSPHNSDEHATFILDADGGMTASIAEEKAIEGYDKMIECTFYIPPKAVAVLSALLRSIQSEKSS